MSGYLLGNIEISILDALAQCGNCGCCPCGCIYYNGYSSFWGNGGLTAYSDNLNEICLIVSGTAPACGNEVPPFNLTDIKSWLISGGILFIKTEWPDGCGNHNDMNAYLSGIGSSITVGATPIACTGGAGGYVGTVANLPVTAGIGPTMDSIGFAAEINGGTTIVTAPYCSAEGRPGGPVIAGEQIGSGVVFITGDSNLDVTKTQLMPINAVNIRNIGGNYF